MTVQLHASVADAIRAAVQSGKAPSANVFVENAVRRYLRELRRDEFNAAYLEAAKDPDFVAEMEQITREFDAAIADGLE